MVTVTSSVSFAQLIDSLQPATDSLDSTERLRRQHNARMMLRYIESNTSDDPLVIGAMEDLKVRALLAHFEASNENYKEFRISACHLCDLLRPRLVPAMELLLIEA